MITSSASWFSNHRIRCLSDRGSGSRSCLADHLRAGLGLGARQGTHTREDTTNAHNASRRGLLAALVLGPVASAHALSRAQAQTAPPAPPAIAQPTAPSKAAFLERARELRDASAAAGDQPYGAVVVRNGLIVGEGRSQVVGMTDPTAHSELMAVRDAARRLGTRSLSDCDMYSSATPCPMCQGGLYWAAIRRVYTEGALEQGLVPKLGC